MAQNTATATAVPVTAAAAATSWRYQVFGCCETPTLCINTMFCAPCVIAQIRGKLGSYMGFKNFKNFLYALIILYVLVCVLSIVTNIVVNVLVAEAWEAAGDGDVAGFTKKTNEAQTMDIVLSIPIYIIEIIFIYIVFKTRLDARAHKKFQEDNLNDCLCSVFCAPCTVVQTAREVEVTEECMNMKEPEGAMTGLDKV
jgi:Cys-rich protein (TIGR01571 family)